MHSESHLGSAVPTVHGRTGWTNMARPSRVTVPERAHPLAKLVFRLMAAQGVSYSELEFRSGILLSTIKAWRSTESGTASPSTAALEAALGALGFTLIAIPRLEMLSPQVRAKLDDIALEFRSDNESLGAAIATASEWPEFARNHLPTTHKLAGNA